MSFVLQPHLRNPVLLAKDWTTLDVLSGGRTALGLGLGTGAPADVEREYELAGIPKKRRGKAFEESIEILKRLWTEEQVTYEGSIFSVRDVSIGFAPARNPHPPLLIAAGGYVPKQAGFGPNDFYSEVRAGTFWGPWDRVAQLGDGWITGSPERCAERIQEFVAAGVNSLKFTMADEDQLGQMRMFVEKVRPLLPV